MQTYQPERPISLFHASYSEIISLFRPDHDPERDAKRLLLFAGILTGPLSLAGMIWGFKVAYKKLLKTKDMAPILSPLFPSVKKAMIVGALLAWAITFLGLFCLYIFVSVFFHAQLFMTPLPYVLLMLNTGVTFFMLGKFANWRTRIQVELEARTKFGTAREARPEELEDLKGKSGIYIGCDYAYHRQGNLLTVASPRSGKFTSLIAPHLLGKGNYRGSNIVIDVKGEAYAVTNRYNRRTGRVLVLDPWRVMASDDEISYFNPLDLLSPYSESLSDDCDIIAEMIVPRGGKGDQFFIDRARALITGIILFIALDAIDERRTLTTLWTALRLPTEKLEELADKMAESDNAIVRSAGTEMLNLIEKGEKTFASILSTAQDQTEFLKSEALQQSMARSSFDVNTLSDGMTTLYVIIPPDQLETPNAKWLRLIVSTTLMAVVRNRNKRVTFILDEFASLGYLPLIKTAMAMYTGYNITIWPILQSLIQLKNYYQDEWEVFLATAAVKTMFNLGDNFTCQYLSNLLGVTTVVSYKSGKLGQLEPESTQRLLFTPDEIRRGSADNIFALIEQRPVTYFPKVPYFDMPDLEGRYDQNPYYEGSKED